jgi:predicted ribosomally synthesized peptide with SipW-like signal peptide
MPRIILSLALITIVIGALGYGATTAFFSDTETSVGNVFTAGAIDLTVDNESYYNGVLNASTTWAATDLTVEKFFDFGDLKPDDYGEDTISLHVKTNDAFMCANVKLTSNNDNTQSEPEALVDGNGTTTGELANLVNFIWWADDGDNVFEDDENVISQGPIGALGVGGSTTIALADSVTNIWNATGTNPRSGPIPGNQTYFIGKAWCFGTIATAPIVQDNSSTLMSPAGDNGGTVTPGEPEDGGITCNGSALGNESQTDSLTADVTFTVVQARNNSGYLCVPPVVRPTGKVVVTKVVVNDNGGNNIVSDFSLFVDDNIVVVPLTSGVTTTVPVGTYNVTETGVPGYAASFSDDCDSDGNVTVLAGQTKYCTITNNDLPANITLFKNVINNTNDGDTNFGPTNFGLRVDGGNVPHNSSIAVVSNTPHTINEVGRIGYAFVGPITGTSSYGKSCPAVLGGAITLDEGETIVCTITNDDN